MRTIDVLCEGCGSEALSVTESEYSDSLIGREGVCASCSDSGHCDLFGDTDEAIRFFPDPAPVPIVYTATHRYGPVKPMHHAELALQVRLEAERQRHELLELRVPFGATMTTSLAVVAKSFAGWPECEWKAAEVAA